MVETTSGSAKVTLPKDTEILITRAFAAPPRLVYKAWTTPELVERWWAGRRGKMKSVEIDLREGGFWRYVMEATGDFEVAFHGEFRELVENERIVTTEVYEGAPEGTEGALNLVTFTESDAGGTRLELLVQCADQETRDAIIESGMEVGMQEQYDLLDEFALTLA
jgi:uncharacterized protein YndB with AHSA1/START domain